MFAHPNIFQTDNYTLPKDTPPQKKNKNKEVFIGMHELTLFCMQNL